ncbi:MAG: pyridoxal 5'-phosphate synthase glutaminase subunit PdxT [bacterium]|nr:pyridoxal 5'-phosphate synthase glutaminase subunit PdxT [bacterium]
MKIGLLDIQGSVKEHLDCLQKLSVDVVLVKKVSGLDGLGGLIIPGGESTTLGKLLKKFGLWDGILQRVEEGMAVWGTCAGAILLSQMGLLDVDVERNAYGGQLESFEGEVVFKETVSSPGIRFPGVFIRAPKIVSTGEGVEVLGTYGKDVVAARSGKLMATTFHPELTDDLSVHRYFLEMCG